MQVVFYNKLLLFVFGSIYSIATPDALVAHIQIAKFFIHFSFQLNCELIVLNNCVMFF